jgi:hypothetical protein
MRIEDCRFFCPPPQRNRAKAFLEGPLERSKIYSNSKPVEQNAKISRAGWRLKQLARDALREPEICGFIGACLAKSPTDFGALLCEPDVKALSGVIKLAEWSLPAGKDEIVRSAHIAIALMKMRNRMLFEGPASAFAYYDAFGEAKLLHSAHGEEIHNIRMELHEHGRLIWHPKVAELHDILKDVGHSPTLVLCETGLQANILHGLLALRYNVDVSCSLESVVHQFHHTLILFSPTLRLREAIKNFNGNEVIILASKGTWEEGAYWHYIELEKASKPELQGKLDLKVPPDYER